MVERLQGEAGVEPDAPAQTVQSALRRIIRSLRDGGIGYADQEARELVLMAAGLTPLQLIGEPQRRLTVEQAARVDEFLSRRLRHEPLTRIAGEREFYGRPFMLSAATLDPRPDTETLVTAVLEIVDDAGWRGRPLRILDLGTGTGCILVTLLAELPGATGVGIDIAADAVATAAENSRRLGVADRALFLTGDGPAAASGRFDLVVSNPPYIPSSDIAGLEAEVRDFDPRAALDGGGDGLDFYRAWIPAAAGLAPQGWLVFEIGAGQADAVAAVLSQCARREAAAAAPRRWTDLGGHTRVVAIGLHERAPL